MDKQIIKKRIQLFAVPGQTVGFIVLSLSSIFREKLSDFALGFCEGLSVALILVGFVYVVYCLAKGENPYKMA